MGPGVAISSVSMARGLEGRWLAGGEESTNRPAGGELFTSSFLGGDDIVNCCQVVATWMDDGVYFWLGKKSIRLLHWETPNPCFDRVFQVTSQRSENRIQFFKK